MGFASFKTGDPVDIPGTSAFDGRSVVNSEEYLTYSPEQVWGGFSFLPDNPEAQNKHVAFRESTEEAKNQAHGDLLDPTKFFGVNDERQFWDILGQYVDAERGGHGSNLPLKLEEASKDGNRYYRTQMSFEKPELHVTMVWSAAAGFNPVSFAMSSDPAGERLLSVKQWEWRKSDDIYIPDSHREVSYFAQDGLVNYRRDVALTDSKLNQPIDPDLFTYRGLGMGDGDLIVDRIKKVVFIIKNGEAVKLANFKEGATPASSAGISLPMLMTSLSAIALLVLLAVRLRRKPLVA